MRCAPERDGPETFGEGPHSHAFAGVRALEPTVGEELRMPDGARRAPRRVALLALPSLALLAWAPAVAFGYAVVRLL